MKLLGSDRRAEAAVENVYTSTILAAVVEHGQQRKKKKKKKRVKKGKTVQTRLKTNIMCSSYAHSVQSVKIHVLLAFVQRLT